MSRLQKVEKKVPKFVEANNARLRLLWVRRQQVLTQDGIAQILQTSRSSYASKEAGESNLTNEQLCRLHDDLGVNLNWLLTGYGKPWI